MSPGTRPAATRPFIKALMKMRQAIADLIAVAGRAVASSLLDDFDMR